MGVVGAVTPLQVPARVFDFDMWVMALATILLMPYMIGARGTLGRIESILFLVFYGAYIAAIGIGIDHIIPA
jgi:Ca2+/Na+ antiporter